MAQHLIHRTLFDLRLSTAKDATDKQHQAAQLFHTNLVKVMEEVFDEYVPNDRNWRFDKLEIDLGDLDLNDNESWQIALRERLTSTLLDFKKTEKTGKPLSISDLESFIYFLKTGRLPWWSSASLAFDPSEKLIMLVKQEPERLRQALKAIYTEGGVLERLVQQCSEKSLKTVMDTYTRNPKSLVDMGEIVLKALLSFTKQVKNDTPSVASISSETLIILKKQLPKFYFHAVLVSNTEGGQIEAFWQQIINFLKQYDNFSAFMLYFKKHYLPKMGNKRRIDITHAIDEKGDFKVIVGENQTDKQTQPQSNKVISEKTVQQQSNKKEDPEPLVFDDKEKDTLFIHNAGLILIAPFFRHVFEALGFIENKAFTTIEMHQRAVLLSQYLVTHETQLPEYQLVLNKLLCGYPLDETLPATFEPTEAEQKACTELYETIKENWGAMKRTSEGVFRTSFLQRMGKLQKRTMDEAWQLTVERQTIDILFETVPPKWSFGFVKLPWMVSPIWTEW